jgi:hypothetical protein
MNLTASAHSRDLLQPNRKTVMDVKVIPIMSTGLRPMISLMRPQKIEEMNCPVMNEDAIHPE